VHELSLAEAVVQIASRHAAGRPVRAVELRVGALRQVVPASLQFAFELLSSGTVLEGAELVIEAVPARGRCRACGAETTMTAFPLQCTGCGGLDLEVIAGEELLVDALELEETATVSNEGITHGG
jgi:hydrogenase nickel incorporation protein HypA/HybF